MECEWQQLCLKKSENLLQNKNKSDIIINNIKIHKQDKINRRISFREPKVAENLVSKIYLLSLC